MKVNGKLEIIGVFKKYFFLHINISYCASIRLKIIQQNTPSGQLIFCLYSHAWTPQIKGIHSETHKALYLHSVPDSTLLMSYGW
jgi:hypothetical protein